MRISHSQLLKSKSTITVTYQIEELTSSSNRDQSSAPKKIQQKLVELLHGEILHAFSFCKAFVFHKCQSSILIDGKGEAVIFS